MKSLKTFAAAALLLAGFAVQAETYALCVGINNYPEPVDNAGKPVMDEFGERVSFDLRGCINDAKTYQDLLTKHYGVKSSNIRILTDDKATLNGFIDNFKWLLSNAKAGDQVIFTYSGHGTQIEDSESTEPDKIEEGIVLADDEVVIDDVFADLKTAITKAGINVTFVFDSCFSGGMSRDGKFRSRTMPASIAGAKLKAVPKSRFTPTIKNVGLKMKNQLDPAGSFAFIYASQEDVPSMDFGGNDEIKPHGVFTLTLEEALDADPMKPVGALMEGLHAMFDDIFNDSDIMQRPSGEFSSPERAKKPIFLK